MKKNVAVIFGGNSVEHEISIITAIQAMENIDRDKYKVIPVYLTKSSDFYTSEDFINIEVFKHQDLGSKNIFGNKYKIMEFIKKDKRVVIKKQSTSLFGSKHEQEIDVFFPIVHGTNVEDGKLQGFFEHFNIPIVGPSTLSGAIGQDKSVSKDILETYNIPQTPYIWILENDINNLDELTKDLQYPLIIKPASLGSSIGIEVAQDKEQLREKVVNAFNFDDVIVIENKLNDIQELNISIFKNKDKILLSPIEEVYGLDNILSFTDKYMSGSKNKSEGMANMTRQIPAKIPDKVREDIKVIAKKVYKVLRCKGLVRLDLIIKDDKIYVNEINSIPGSLSYYLWEADGIKYKDLLDQNIQVAIKDKYLKDKKETTFSSNVLNLKGLKTKK